jgi:hypothetical protein
MVRVSIIAIVTKSFGDDATLRCNAIHDRLISTAEEAAVCDAVFKGATGQTSAYRAFEFGQNSSGWDSMAVFLQRQSGCIDVLCPVIPTAWFVALVSMYAMPGHKEFVSQHISRTSRIMKHRMPALETLEPFVSTTMR